MPSPGASAIKDAIKTTGYVITVDTPGADPDPETGETPTTTHSCTFNEDARVIVGLANAIHAGWTSSYPTTVTTMSAAITAEFSELAGSPGLPYLVAIGGAIDTDVALWAASFVPNSGTHSYTPSKGAMTTAFTAATPMRLPGVDALASSVFDAFLAGFSTTAG